MGNWLTREDAEPEEEPQKIDLSTTPVSAPLISDTCLDPRSPSANITRTPLLLTSYLKPSDEETEEECDQAKTLILAADPRSPTTEYVRTPIVVGETKKTITEIRNKNLDKVRKCEIQVTPTRTGGDKRIMPKLLASSPKIVSVSVKRKSLVGLLETNLDFTETDLDDVFKAKVTLAENCTETDEMETIPEQTMQNDTEVPEGTTKTEEIATDTAKEVQSRNFDVNVTAQVIDFDKKLTNLIYEDTENHLPLLPKSKTNRTPLIDRNGEVKKSATKLKVSDKPRKSDCAKSKIPVLSRKSRGRDENTPPRNFSGRRKSKRLEWDNTDKTLVI